jgi:uncharacterized protein
VSPPRRLRPLDVLTYPLAGLLAEPPGSQRSYRIAAVVIPLDEPLELAEPIEGVLRVARTNRGVLVDARLRASLRELCSRCLAEIEIPLELVISEEVLPSVELTTGLPVDVTAEPDVERLTSGHELDFGRLVRAAIALAEPIAPLCRPDCPGLCPVCGAPAGAGHDHPEETVDPRLAPLLGWHPVDAAPRSDYTPPHRPLPARRRR